jgi:8-oxo-dGTP diphosphatase
MSGHDTYVGPIVTVDAVVLRFNERLNRLEFLTVIRDQEPFAGVHALPGVYLGRGESIVNASDRAVLNKAGLCPENLLSVRQVGVSDCDDRDPRGHVLSISVVTAPKVGTGVQTGFWKNVYRNSGLAFDHHRIVDDVMSWYRDRFWNESDLFRSLTHIGVDDDGNPITTASRVAMVQRVLTRADVDPSNVRRKMDSLDWIEPNGQTWPNPAGSGRPAVVYVMR